MTIPSGGNVYFLFTDIEGSTKLAQEHSEKLHDLLDVHNTILKRSFESAGGHVFKIVGDAFCSAFSTLAGAVNAAVRAQRELHKYDWGPARLKVRMGIHSGLAEWNGSDYMGYLTLARTNRIMSAANGGQVVISADALGYDEEGMAPSADERDVSCQGTGFRRLGVCRLKDLVEPVTLFQITADGMEEEFPPLKTLDLNPNNLPIQLTSFIGRSKELEELKQLIGEKRLVTLLGPGGTGKTRLALQAAAELIDNFPNGIWLVDLAPVSDATLFGETVLSTLKVSDDYGNSPADALLKFLKDKEALIIFDNCEHIIETVSTAVEAILKGSEKVKILGTSRESLRCYGEFVFKVSSLRHPGPGERPSPVELAGYEAVRLFIERALAVNPAFRLTESNAGDLAEICFQLDGIPLAIELAAARTKLLSLAETRKRLEDRFSLLKGGNRTALPRQKTLRAMIDWSHDLLNEEEKIMWRRLSVFYGGWKLEVAEAVCADGIISSEDVLNICETLTEKSILSFSESAQRFGMLETIRQYGREKLSEAEEDKIIFRSHLEHFLKFCEDGIGDYTGPRSGERLAAIEAEYPNIQAALKWSADNSMFEEGSRLACSLGKFWEIRGHTLEASTWLERLLAGRDVLKPETLADSLKLAGIMHSILGANEKAMGFLNEAIEIYTTLDIPAGLSQALNLVGLTHYDLGNFDDSRKFLEQSLEMKRKFGSPISICSSLNSLGLLCNQLGNYDEAMKYYEEALSIAEELKDDNYLGILYNNIAEVAEWKGEQQKAFEFFGKSMELDLKTGNKHGLCISLVNMGQIDFRQNRIESALEKYNECLNLAEETGFKLGEDHVNVCLGDLYQKTGDQEKAQLHYARVFAGEKGNTETKTAVTALCGLADIACKRGDHQLSCKLIGAALYEANTAGSNMFELANLKLSELKSELYKAMGESEAESAIQHSMQKVKPGLIQELCSASDGSI
ncbi:MAG: tetratricopeptide repeat protein [Ignavibacteria bacterium]|nr:tetratricopeptide repeat protein [Ignavibacteria bacterium]